MDNDNKTVSFRINFSPKEIRKIIKEHLYLDYSIWNKNRKSHAKKLACVMRNKIINDKRTPINPEVFLLIAYLAERIIRLESLHQSSPPHGDHYKNIRIRLLNIKKLLIDSENGSSSQ